MSIVDEAPDQQPQQPASRREVWLSIALAIARDGLPEPKELSFYATWFAFHVESAVAGERWAHQFGVNLLNAIDRPDGTRSTTWSGEYRGWTVDVRASEPSDAETEPTLAAEVASAIDLARSAEVEQAEAASPVDEAGTA